MRIVPATRADLPDILDLFDEVQSWLALRGLSGQWGTVPFSQMPRQIAQFEGWIDAGTFFVARGQREILGTIVLNPEPPGYAKELCDRRPGEQIYIEALAVRRGHAGSGIGRELLAWAQRVAGERDMPWLRLDCWAENEALRSYYRRAGFSEFGTFRVGTWQGSLFEKPVAQAEQR